MHVRQAPASRQHRDEKPMNAITTRSRIVGAGLAA